MQTLNPTIRVQILNGTWETIGVDRAAAIYADADSLTMSANGYGSDQASFTLKRDTRVVWPDLLAFSPVDIEIGGELVWSGRVKETPTSEGTERQINVSCEGWQYHLDDDTVVRNYAQLDQSGWQDWRTFTNAPLSALPVAGSVAQDNNGNIVIGYGNGSTWATSTGVGVMLDQGPDPNLWARRLEFTVVKGAGSPANVDFYARAETAPPLALIGGAINSNIALLLDAIPQTALTSPTTYSLTVPVRADLSPTTISRGGAYRYLVLFIYCTVGYAVTADDTVAISNIKTWTDTAYKSSFTASRAIANAIDLGCDELTTDADRTYCDTVLADHPLNYYRMSQLNSGTASSLHQPDIGTTNLPTTNTIGVFSTGSAALIAGDSDSSVTFNGATSGYATGTTGTYSTPVQPAPAFSLEAWVNLTSTAGVQEFIIVGNVIYRYLRNNAGTCEFAFVRAAGTLAFTSVASAFSTGTTYHVVGVYDGVDMRIYINGVLSNTPAAETATPGNNDGPLTLGGYIGGGQGMFGRLDEVANYNYALTSAQVLQHYRIGSNGPSVGTTIGQTSFEIPEFAPGANPKRPREIIDAVNAYHAWQFKVDQHKNSVFRALPTSPILETGAWAGAQFEDASANSGADIFTHALGSATQADGTTLLLKQAQAVTSYTPTSAVVNPNADVDANNWTPYVSTAISRTTVGGEFVTSPAGFKAITPDSTNPTAWVEGVTQGTFVAGKTYRIRVVARSVTSNGGAPLFSFRAGALGGGDYVTMSLNPASGGAFTEYILTWVPNQTWPGRNVVVQLQSGQQSLGVAGHVTMFYDDVSISQGVDPTIPGRWGFNRTALMPIQAKMTTAAMQQVLGTYLGLHRTTPFRGSLTVQPGGLRSTLFSGDVHPARALTMTQELIRFSHIIDPDTSAVGRYGRIATVKYNHKDQQSEIDIDSTRKAFEALLERIGILQAARSNLR